MGRFKNHSTTNPIAAWLLQQGFEDSKGAQGQSGFVKVYPAYHGLYYVWVTINLSRQKIYLYQEYNCGGMVAEAELEIEDELLTDLNRFIDGVDEKLEPWIGDA